MTDLNKYFEVALTVHAVCSAVAAVTPTPRDNKFLRKAYKIIEVGGLVVGRAKQR
jgi:hypothetical protein